MWLRSDFGNGIHVSTFRVRGGRFVHWDTLQEEGQIKHFLKHWCTNSTISQTLRMTVAWAQWQSGFSTSFMTAVGTQLPYLECRWLNFLRLFLHHIHTTIMLDCNIIPAPERLGDQYIVEEAKAMQHITDKELAIINYCRLYLHVTTTSALYNATGS
jgi:hypothetical protein